jgi:hypothetical protein
MLFEAVDHTLTRVGQAVLYRSLTRPLSDIESVVAKQEAAREIEHDARLREGLEKLLVNAKKREKDYYDLLFATFLGAIGNPAHPLEIGGFGYESYLEGTRFMLSLADEAGSLPKPKSPYLGALVKALSNFANSRAHALMKGPAYRSEKEILTAAEKRWYTPAVKFRPSMFKPGLFILGALLVVLALEFAPFLMELAASVSPVLWLFLMPLGLVYIPIVGNFDRDACIYPLRDIFKRSPEVQGALDALGGIDELFFTGTAAEVTPIRELDGRQIGIGKRGPVTTKVQKAFFDVVNGRNAKYKSWLTPVHDAKAKKAARGRNIIDGSGSRRIAREVLKICAG